MATARFLVRGRVQRVGFRAATRAQALRLGLSGHARNLDDGRVEVLAQGAPQQLDALARWLEVGPTLARVDAVARLAVEGDAVFSGFATG